MSDKEIIKNAPEGATHYAPSMNYIAFNKSGDWMRYDVNGFENAKWFIANNYKFGYVKDFRSLADIKRITELEAEASAWSDLWDEAMNVVQRCARKEAWHDEHPLLKFHHTKAIKEGGE